LPGQPVDPGDETTPFAPPSEPPLSAAPDAARTLPELTLPSEESAELSDEARILPEEPALLEATQADAQPNDILPSAPLHAEGQPAGTLATEFAAGEPPETDVSGDAQPDPPGQIEAKTLQANWMAALHPGFRGEAGHNAATYATGKSTVTAEPDETLAKEPSVPSPHSERPIGYLENARETSPAPVALDGYCPVALLTDECWSAGDPQWTTTHKGLSYQFSGEAQLERFLANPDEYTPVYSGNDPVLVVDENRREAGKTDFCVTYKGRLHMFASARTLARFQESPQRYAEKQ